MRNGILYETCLPHFPMKEPIFDYTKMSHKLLTCSFINFIFNFFNRKSVVLYGRWSKLLWPGKKCWLTELFIGRLRFWLTTRCNAIRVGWTKRKYRRIYDDKRKIGRKNNTIFQKHSWNEICFKAMKFAYLLKSKSKDQRTTSTFPESNACQKSLFRMENNARECLIAWFKYNCHPMMLTGEKKKTSSSTTT